MKQTTLPVISDWKTFEKFLDTDLSWCILMDFHINFIQELINQLHHANKQGIVHMDFLHGIANDSFGAQFMCQKIHVDGLISTKPKVIESAKANHCISILRLFLIDSRSLKKGCSMANTLQPDYLEILPATSKHAVNNIRKYCDLAIIGGGLIESSQDVDECLESGMISITSSNLELCVEYQAKTKL